MISLEEKIHKIGILLNFVSEKDVFENQDDIRSITMHSLTQTIQSYYFSIILNKELEDIEYVKKNISQEIKNEDLKILNYIYDGFLKNAFFNNSFVFIENHIRQIALNYEITKDSFNNQSLTQTFKNVRTKIIFFSNLNIEDEKLFEFYCFLRNTMHNVGFQTKEDKSIVLIDNNSIYEHKEIELKLLQNMPNDISFEQQLILLEQIIKLIEKINFLIPIDDFIKHKFSDLGFNN